MSTTPGNPRNPGNVLEFKNPPGNPGNFLEFNGPPGNFCVRRLTALVSGHKRLAFYCLDTGNGFNDDDVSLYIKQCSI